MSLLFATIWHSCDKKREAIDTPWGTTLNTEDSVSEGKAVALSDIQNTGELIALILSGPDTYYEYRNVPLGMQYLMVEKFAQSIGVRVRVEVCKDTTELFRKLKDGEGDLIAVQLRQDKQDVLYCGAKDAAKHTCWAVQEGNTSLATALNNWFKPDMVAQISREQEYILSARSIRRHIYSPMLNSKRGVISQYDHLFKQYANIAGMDWRLMAAQCYQESCFDPQAQSWAGACGLMQIMPSTARELGLPTEHLFHPQKNIEAAARYLQKLQGKFYDVPPSQRIFFVLAGYNGGTQHVRDAMRLTKKYGGNPGDWAQVGQYVLKLRQAAYYTDPVVSAGYMRGDETFDYVNRIYERYKKYAGVAGFSSSSAQPYRKHHKNRKS